MPNYEKCGDDVHEMARSILEQFETHLPLVKEGVQIDLIFAHPFKDDLGLVIEPAIKVRGREAYGVARLIGVKDRVMGRGDGEILIDGHWWENATEEQQRALLDHELHHFEVKRDSNHHFVRDSIGRPVLKLRKHDIEMGWFSVIAARHVMASQECIQAKQIRDGYGQLFWPELTVGDERAASPTVRGITSMTIVHGEQSVTIDSEDTKRIIKSCDAVLNNPTGEDEELIQQCIEVVRTEHAAVALLQRRLRLGYTRAARIMDELERRGIVGPAKGAEPREVFLEKAPADSAKAA